MRTEICCGCGKLINSSYYFCPWCGFSRVDQNTEKSAHLRYEQHHEQIIRKRHSQLKEMEKQLVDLEQELSVLVLSAEMHK